MHEDIHDKIKAFAAAMVIATALGCRSYEPRPLEPESHRAAWLARADATELREAVARWSHVDDPFDPIDGISLEEGKKIALAHHADVRLARGRAAAAAASAAHAGRLPDPELSFELLRILDGGPRPWVIAPGIAFALPWPGRLAAELAAALAEARAAALAVTEAEWRAAYDVERAWIEWSAELARLASEERLAEALSAPARAAERLAAAGEIDPAEAALFALESARRRAELRRRSRRVHDAHAELHAVLGLPVGEATRLLPIDIPAHSPGKFEAHGGEELRHPVLACLAAEYVVAERTLHLEVRRQYPTFGLGPLFESDAGQSRLGLYGAAPLPLFDRNRAAIAVATAQREVARTAFEIELERLSGELAATATRAEFLEGECAEFDAILLPLARRQVADALRLAELGEGSTSFVLESLSRAQAVELDRIDAHAERARAAAKLAYLTGPPETTSPRTSEDSR